ncbi:MAG TPA: lipopolysaccharide biosynthesis protein [Steroidobacteraceae bacterium]|nr:lipopolysaccharide biosynthesis protein [Steroidobacteraceae bacterium]
MKRSLREAVGLALGTSVTALGTLVGVRVLTQFLPPSGYGALSLIMGVSVLAISLVSTPLTQAAIHFYPSVATDGSPRLILQSLLRCTIRMAPWILAGGLLAALIYMEWGGGTLTLTALATALLAADCWRAANLSLLNAARRHLRYVAWTFLDAWGRPLAGAAAVFAVGPSVTAVLAAYVIVSVTLLLAFSIGLWPATANATRTPATGAPYGNSADLPNPLDARMWSYALPLIPLGVIGWASNLGDRYVIAGVLSVADAGLYAAVYGLASAPFMMVGGTVELALRPIHQTAVAAGNQARANFILRAWVTAVSAVCGLGVLVLAVGHREVAAVCVGAAYRQASGLMPWIGLGYAIRSVSYVFERVSYAYARTHRVLVTQLWAVVATVVATPAGVLLAGLKGAAMAVPVYFTVQCLVAVVLARRTLREVNVRPESAGLDHPLASRA